MHIFLCDPVVLAVASLSPFRLLDLIGDNLGSMVRSGQLTVLSIFIDIYNLGTLHMSFIIYLWYFTYPVTIEISYKYILPLLLLAPRLHS